MIFTKDKYMIYL